MPKLVVVGGIGGILRVPSHEAPSPGETVEIDALEMDVGGSAVNTAIVASRLGVTTAIAGVVGDDFIGAQIRGKLQSGKVDVTRLKTFVDRTSPMSIVQTAKDGTATTLRHPGTDLDFDLSTDLHRVPCKIVHLASPECVRAFWPHKFVELVRLLKVSRRVVSVDLFADGHGRGRKEIARNVQEHLHLLELVDVVFMNEREARLVSGRKVQESVVNYFHERGVKTVVIKRGERGAFVSWKGGGQAVGAARVNVADTSGAGDSFVAGFLAGLLKGYEPPHATGLGCTIGGLCCRERGPLAGTGHPALVSKALARFEEAVEGTTA